MAFFWMYYLYSFVMKVAACNVYWADDVVDTYVFIGSTACCYYY